MKITNRIFPLMLVAVLVMAVGCNKQQKLPSLWPESTGQSSGPLSSFSMKMPEFKAPTFKKKAGPSFWESIWDPKSRAISNRLASWGQQ